jgi:hypothetical protein
MLAVLALGVIQEGEGAETGVAVGVLQVMLLLNAIFLWLLERMRVLLRQDDSCWRGPRSGGLFRTIDNGVLISILL